jgi:hypothetical protein
VSTVLAAHVVAEHRPGGPTGWPGPLSTTAGGHTTAIEFVVDGRSWRVALLAPDPRYRDRPSAAFSAAVERACGEHYAVRSVGGFAGSGELRVRTHSVFVSADGRPGADLHVVYEPDLGRGDPPADDAMHWIQVVRRGAAVELDNGGRGNPFYPYGGRTSVDGRAVVNVQATPQSGVGRHLFSAETFLARDTGRRAPDGRGVVEVLGGVEWGWELTGIG